MTDILDRVAKLHSEFRPANADEFFALRLAEKLNNGAAARHYAELVARYSQSKLLAVFSRARATHLDPGRRFHQLLDALNGNGSHDRSEKSLAAIRIERRAIGLAVFSGDHLRYADARQLSSFPAKAAETTVGFINKFWQRFRFESAAVEIATRDHHMKRQDLHERVRKTLRTLAIPIAEAEEKELLAAFGHPPLRFRQDMRAVIEQIYPVLNEGFGAPWTCDAAALGLYVQTERLFNNINQPLL